MEKKSLPGKIPESCAIAAFRAIRVHRIRGFSSGKLLLSIAAAALIGCMAAVFSWMPALTAGSGSENIFALESPNDGITVYYGAQPEYARTPSGDEKVRLVNSRDATDPTWEQLKTFLLADRTDQKDYDRLTFPCGAYAELVHNNAEAAGIKSAWVVVEFEGESIKHAINAFYTVDQGLVYIDSSDSWFPASLSVNRAGGSDRQDKVAYMAIGKEYGLIDLDVSTGTRYAAYEEYRRKKLDCEASFTDYYSSVRDHMQEAMKYEQSVYTSRGRVYAGEITMIGSVQDWRQQLDSESLDLNRVAEALFKERESLGTFWDPVGIVAGIEIYW